MNKKNTTFLNSLYMDFLTENELDLFLKSLDEIWTAELYTNLKQNGLIRHVISKVWNKGQHRITQVFEYESRDSFKKCESILKNKNSIIFIDDIDSHSYQKNQPKDNILNNINWDEMNKFTLNFSRANNHFFDFFGFL